MKKILQLRPLSSRRQFILSSLALMLMARKSVLAKEEDVTLRVTPRMQDTAVSPHPPRPATGKKIVMIDPGHGGIDSGAVGQEGSEEKHIVLEIANHIRHLLSEHPHIDVRLTRETDHFIPLGERVEIAHQHGADLFMSVHADGFTSPVANGASVFALSNRGASSTMAKYLSEKENAADNVGGVEVATKDRYLQQVLFDLVQTDTIKNSLTLGKHVLNQIRPMHHLHSQHTEQAAFAVLKSPSIPSVLVETSFITNPQEEKLLGTTAFRQKIAGAIANGIVSFFNEYDAGRRMG
ncbi:N-acetylmuramoyl-L-alanine amidase AmiA [Erwinia sp. INIA-01]|uniref:N-acetylmuramoyl-L-alanine amidase AmiA n=1 Tax=Erwinia sp. INIA01 TaxID=2991500 RepID=UPI002224F164|nr:N-acetylmuramoyl-L-alanine amidase AmiA [Erwinia sp. INIA01]MCW1875379.1 N-acetylmuramoyl-L-alanine amidase AmiA [Erwinia sp. INIA01]